MLLWYLPAVLSGQMLTVMFHTSLLPHYSLITLLLEVLIHIWMLTYVFREIFIGVLELKKQRKKSFVCFLLLFFKFILIDNYNFEICFPVYLSFYLSWELNSFFFSSSENIKSFLYLLAIRDIAVHNQNLFALGCKI